jgi:predicted acylesterase/phospholipase RssA
VQRWISSLALVNTSRAPDDLLILSKLYAADAAATPTSTVADVLGRPATSGRKATSLDPPAGGEVRFYPMFCYVLAGAGARAVFQAGVLEELYQHERFRSPRILAGTSGGAINAALLAAGRTPRELRDFWLRFAATPPVDANTPFLRRTIEVLAGALLRHVPSSLWASRGGSLWWAAKRAWRHRPLDSGSLAAVVAELLLTRNFGIVSDVLNHGPEPSLLLGEPVRRLFVDALGGEHVNAAPGVRLAINAVDIRRCRPARFVNARTPEIDASAEYIFTSRIDVDMVLGSAAIPLLLPAVVAGEHRLWDGGLLVNAPLASAVSLGAEEIVPVLSNALPDGSRELQSAGDAVQRLLDVILEHCFNLDRKLLLDRNSLARHPGAAGGKRYREIQLYQAIRPERNAVFDTGSYLDFSHRRLNDMYDEGRRIARAWLAAGPQLDTLKPPP